MPTKSHFVVDDIMKLSLSPRLWEDFGDAFCFGAMGVDTTLNEICNPLQRAWIFDGSNQWQLLHIRWTVEVALV